MSLLGATFGPSGTRFRRLVVLCRNALPRVGYPEPAGSPPVAGAIDINVAATGCVPASASAYAFNATVVPSGPLGFLTLWQQGMARPLASTLNSVDGAITSNLALVPTANGSISAYASSSTHLVLDVWGFFAP